MVRSCGSSLKRTGVARLCCCRRSISQALVDTCMHRSRTSGCQTGSAEIDHDELSNELPSLDDRQICDLTCGLLSLRMNEAHVEITNNLCAVRFNNLIDGSRIVIYLGTTARNVLACDFKVLKGMVCGIVN